MPSSRRKFKKAKGRIDRWGRWSWQEPTLSLVALLALLEGISY